MWETWVQSLSCEVPWEKETARIRFSSLENFMDCIVHGVANSWTWLSYFHFQVAQWYKEPTCQCRRCKRYGFNPCLGRSPGNLLQYACPEKRMDRGAWQAIVHRVAKRWSTAQHYSHFKSLWATLSHRTVRENNKNNKIYTLNVHDLLVPFPRHDSHHSSL